MRIAGSGALVTGGASGLGMATAQLLLERGASVTVVDLPGAARRVNGMGASARWMEADVTDEAGMRRAVQSASADVPLRIVVHCAGQVGRLRILEGSGRATPLEPFTEMVRINLVGTYNVLRLATEGMVAADLVGEERGVVVLTASIAAFEGRIGQVHYASSKAGVVGLTLAAARDLAEHRVRVATIAPGAFDTPMLDELPLESRLELGDGVPHPRRLGHPTEFALLASHIVENPMINGEVIRIDGAQRLGPRR